MSAALLLLGLAPLLALAAGQVDFVCRPQKTFPHPDDCSRYFYCDNTNTPQVFYCSPGLQFNPDSGLCDLPEGSPCPYVPPAGQPSLTTLPDDKQSTVSSLPGEEGVVVGQSYANTRQSYTPDLSPPSAPSLPEDGRPSILSLPEDEEQPSPLNTKQLYTPDLARPSVPSLLDLEQPSVSPPADEEVEAGSYVPVFPGRGGPIFRQPVVEDRKDDVGDVVYDNKTENASESFGAFFKALQNFEKTTEEGRQKEEEGEVGHDFVDVKRQAPAVEVGFFPLFNATNEPAIVYGEEEEKTEADESKGASEGIKTKGRCFADSDFFGRKAGSDTVDLTSISEKADELTTSGAEKESKTESESFGNEKKNIDVMVWPLFTISNSSASHDDGDVESSKDLDFPTVRRLEVDTSNSTDDNPTVTILKPNVTSSLQNTETEEIGTVVGLTKEANEGKTPEKVAEIEEAKSTIIFESHSEEEEKEKDEIPDERLTKVVLKETAIL